MAKVMLDAILIESERSRSRRNGTFMASALKLSVMNSPMWRVPMR